MNHHPSLSTSNPVSRPSEAKVATGLRAFFSLEMALALALACAALLLGCASSTPALDASFGKAVHQARANQTLNPQASANNSKPALGIDGQAATMTQEQYVDSFKNPPKTFEVINIGGSINGK